MKDDASARNYLDIGLIILDEGRFGVKGSELKPLCFWDHHHLELVHGQKVYLKT